MEKPVYLDCNATTPLDPQVLDAMLPYLKEDFGNASSNSHVYGWTAAAAVKKAREPVSKAIGAAPKEIFWTSGATESNNLALFGALKNFADGHIITTAVEHKAVLEVTRQASRELNMELTVLPVNTYGQVEPDQVEQALRPNTRLVSVMAANNEIGTLNPITEIGQRLKGRDVLFHVDAAQAFGKIPLDVELMNIDLMSISGHKIYGPKGVGALYVRQSGHPVTLAPMLAGGEQEGGLRPGTLNVPGIVGLGCAAELALRQMDEEHRRLSGWRDRLIAQVLSEVPTARLNGHPTSRLCNNASFSFPHLSPDQFALGLSGLAVSSGSACSSGSGRPSHVLKALGHSDELARATVRIGMGRFTTSDEVDLAAQKIGQMARQNEM